MTTGINDQNGKEIFEGDSLELNYETIIIKGVAKLDKFNKWELYKNEGNHISLEHNKDYIRKV